MVRQAELIRQAQDGDKKARDKVVSDNLGLVHAIVRRFEKRGHDREELFQIGCIGLIKAIDHFDLSLNLAFSTYAVPMITGEIRRFLRDDGMVKVSRSLKENGYKISRAKEVLTTELGRDPSLLELSAMTELGTEEIVMALDANRGVESIYQPVCGSDGDELLLIDQIGDQSDVSGRLHGTAGRRMETVLQGTAGEGGCFKQNGDQAADGYARRDRTADHPAAVF